MVLFTIVSQLFIPMLVKWQVLDKHLLNGKYLIDLFNNIKYVIDWECECKLNIVLYMYRLPSSRGENSLETF